MAFKALFSLLALSVAMSSGLRTKRTTCPDGVNTAVNPQCCFLFPIVEDLKENLFENECGDQAHGALRLIFHDSIGLSTTAGGGGADGSIIVFNSTELSFPANSGIDDVLDQVGPFFHKYSDVLSAGDFVQLAGVVSLTQCPGGPRTKFSFGRPPPKAASPPDLVPEPFDTVTHILERFGDVGLSPEEVIALLSSHSVAGADDVDPTVPGSPFDSTPAVYDSQLFVDVQLRGTLFTGQGGQQGEVEAAQQGLIRLQSDSELARDSRTSCIWQSFVNNEQKMATEFANALFKFSLVGQDASKLTDCSEVIPTGKPFTGQVRLPAGKTQNDIEQACATASFPVLGVAPGPPTSVPPIPQADGS